METIFELVERVLDGFEAQDRLVGSNIHGDAADIAFEEWLDAAIEREQQREGGAA